MKKLIFAIAMLSAAFCAGAASAVPYDMISEVWIYEPRVTTLVFEFDKPLAVAFDLTQSVSVSAELKELTSHEGLPVPDSSWPMSPRKVTAAYTSDEPVKGKICAGKYLIVELSELDSNAASTYISLKRVTQQGGKEKGWNNGREILPYGDKMVYDVKLTSSIKYADGTFTGTDVAFERRGERTLIADDFVVKTFTSDKTVVPVKVNGEEKQIKSIKYALYSPKNVEEGRKYPIVVYLHGSSCRSIYEDGIDDGMTPVLTNQGAITWVKHGTQDCYVLVPQYEFATFDLVKENIAAVLSDASLAIDPARVYVSGLSMGGMGSWEVLFDEELGPKFSAALICCGYPCNDYKSGDFGKDIPAAKLIDGMRKAVARGTRIWLVHSDSDPTVPLNGSLYAYKAMLGMEMGVDMPKPLWSNDKYTYWEALDGQVRFTMAHCKLGRHNTQVGLYSLSPHEVYEYAYAEPMFIRWLFGDTSARGGRPGR